MQDFTPRPVNQAGAQGEEAGRGIANGGARQRRKRGKMHMHFAPPSSLLVTHFDYRLPIATFSKP